MAKTTTNDVLPMNDKMKTVREALEHGRNMAFTRQYETGKPHSIIIGVFDEALSALDSIEAEAGEVVAWMNHGDEKFFITDENKRYMCRDAGGTRDYIQHNYCIPLCVHPNAHGEVELTEEDLAEIAHQQWRKGLRERSITLSGAKLMEDGAMNALRHLTSKYRLIPR